MIEIPETCEFIVRAEDQVHIKLKTNGDTITMTRLRLTQAEGATAAWLINSDKILKVEIKEHIPE